MEADPRDSLWAALANHSNFISDRLLQVILLAFSEVLIQLTLRADRQP